MHMIPFFIYCDLKCLEYNKYLQCSLINNFNFMALGHQQKLFTLVANKQVKYSCDLMWATD